MKKPTKKPHPLFAPATKRNEQGAAALTVLNDIKGGRKPKAWAVKMANISVPKPRRKGA
jgi:hypothetical protein